MSSDEDDDPGANRSPPTPDGGRSGHGWDGSERPSAAVVEAAATATDRDPLTLSPLQRFVDADALDSLLAGTDAAGGRVSVTFEYDGLDVVVDSDGGVAVNASVPDGSGSVAGPETDTELETRLRSLLGAAFRNDVDVRGGWEVRNEPDLPDWEVHVTRVSKSDGDTTR